MHDALTGLPNRVSLQRTLENALAQGGVGALLFMDIDHFKYVNDNFGHRSGDQLIVGVGGVLQEAAKQFNGQVFRLGGDEFAMHLPESLRGQAMQAAEKALDAVRHYRFQASQSTAAVSGLTASIGIALLSVPRQRRHRAALQRRHRDVPGEGRRAQPLRVVRSGCGEPAQHPQARAVGEEAARRAGRGPLVLFSQPVVRLTDSAVHHEILVRIRDDNGNIVLPGQFIELAESLGMVQEIDMRVVERLLDYLRQPEQPDAEDALLREPVARFRSPISTGCASFTTCSASSDIVHNQLVFEITETAAMSDIDVTQQFIRGLKQMGCRFALDDFGAGFSSFYYLKRFDVDYLKIDGGFIRDLATDDGSRIFVKALSDVAHGLDKQVIAEWVEDREVMKILTEMGTVYGQGSLFYRPAPLLDMVPEHAAATGVQ